MGDLGRAVLELTEELVRQASVTGSAGETLKGRWLQAWLQRNCAAAAGLELLAVSSAEPGLGGPASQSEAAMEAPDSLLAFLPAAGAEPTARTLLLLGHYDTVGLEPYGELSAQSLDSAALSAAYSGHSDAQLAVQAQSGEWRFGRGWLDMQGGVASALLAFAHFARSGGLPCNLLLALCPDEERDSAGVRALIPALLDLRQRHGLEFAGLLNADYCTPGRLSQRAGRSRRQPQTASAELDLRGALYGGTIGKLLLGLSVFGLPSHAGEPFAGLNSAALAGWLASQLEQDRALQVTAQGQPLPPPSVLVLRARRERYDVMTPHCSELLVNVFHSGGDYGALWRRLLGRVRTLCREYTRQLRYQQRAFMLREHTPGRLSQRRIEVLDYAALLERLGLRCEDAARELRGQTTAAYDPRAAGLSLLRGLEARLPQGQARVLASLLPPFYPAQLADGPRAARLKKLAQRLGLRWEPVYPYISDMSFFAYDDGAGSAQGLGALARNAPLWPPAEQLQQYAQAAMPVCNIGPLGLGAHSAFERVYSPQLEELPAKLIQALSELAR